ncbi:recombination protein RecT [Pseudomonas nitritireducens]|uniref:Recombination protein RecT n=1 Tax=Pseudomonas nitroreducens TaxID=46680 RepID=A0A7W7P5N5_PSENT|nr:RecT family recombinase [Pseudomonas nitritireducens]MBB4868159.1 recombination protein RecT [Pseudomonas nitritireducens]
MSEKFQAALSVIAKQEDKFMSIVKLSNTDVVFQNELLYAAQAMMNNDYLCGSAIKNPLSLRNAFSQVAASGLTLDPSRQLAYLVPRDGQVVLDVSWRGMIKVAVNDGAIRDANVELVYSNDEFEYLGKRKSPIFKCKPFAPTEERGELLGCYVEAELPDGRFHVEVVTLKEILAARDASELWRKHKKGPWVTYESSMQKKSGIKIARKYWPFAGGKLDKVIEYLNTTGGEGFATTGVPVSAIERYMGTAEVVDPVEPLPTSNEEGQQPEPVVDKAAKTATPDPQPEPEGAVLEGEVQLADEEPDAASNLPEKTVKKVAELVRRAQLSSAWNAALEYVSTWPVDARAYAEKQLKTAQAEAYKTASQGE